MAVRRTNAKKTAPRKGSAGSRKVRASSSTKGLAVQSSVVRPASNGAVLLAREQAARKAAEARTQYLFNVLESIADGLVAYDKEWRYVYVSEKAARMTGLRREDIEGKRIHDLFPERINSASFKEFQRVMKDGKPAQIEYYSVGAKRWLRTNLYPHDSGMTSLFTDITESKRLEEMREEFIGVAAHEMKTPVASAKAYAQVLEALFTGKGDHGSLELAVKMSEQLDKLAHLITNLLDVSKIEGGIMQLRYTTFDFNGLLTEVVDEVRPTARHAIVTKLCRPVLIEADRDRIRQVIMNFLTNAIKYSPHATQIIVTTAVKDGMIECRVQDFGIGIDKKDQAHIFERFYRAQGGSRETYPGIGLGLYISSAIVAQHGGTCKTESVKGKGSIFSFSVPLVRVDAHTRTEVVSKWARPVADTKTYER